MTTTTTWAIASHEVLPVISISHASGAVIASVGMKWLVPPQKATSPRTAERASSAKAWPWPKSQALCT